MKDQIRFWTVVGCLFLFVPAWSQGGMAIKIQEPSERWKLLTLPFTPAPFEMSGTLLPDMFVWSHPTDAVFIAYPERPRQNSWVAEALEKYQIHLLSPAEGPYTLVKSSL